MVLSTCPGFGLVAALLGGARGSDWDMVLSLLARRSGWEWSEGRGRVWALSFRLGTYFGDSKKGTEDVGARFTGGGSEVMSKREQDVRKVRWVGCGRVKWREKSGRLLGERREIVRANT